MDDYSKVLLKISGDIGSIKTGLADLRISTSREIKDVKTSTTKEIKAIKELLPKCEKEALKERVKINRLWLYGLTISGGGAIGYMFNLLWPLVPLFVGR